MSVQEIKYKRKEEGSQKGDTYRLESLDGFFTDVHATRLLNLYVPQILQETET